MNPINIGTAPNDGTGDSLRDAFQKTNDNFIELTKAVISFQTGTTYTIQTSDTSLIIDHSNAEAITVTLPNNAVVGTIVTYVQAGAGQITFSPISGATLVSREGHVKTAGQYALVTLYVRANSDGTSAVWVLGGDTVA